MELEVIMAWSAVPEIIDKLLERYLPKKEEALRNKIKKLERERDDLLKKPQTPRTTTQLDRCLSRLRDAKEALQNRA